MNPKIRLKNEKIFISKLKCKPKIEEKGGKL